MMTDQTLAQSLDGLSLGKSISTSLDPAIMKNNDLFYPSGSPLDQKMPPHDSFPFPKSGDSATSSRFQHLFAGNGFSGPSEANLSSKSEAALFPKSGLSSSDLSQNGNMFGTGPSLTAPLPNGPISQRTSPTPFYGGTWSSNGPSNLTFNASSSDHPSSGALPPTAPSSLPMNPMRFGNNMPATVAGEADIIPTAIVIKNIPFNIKREQLLHIIRDLGIPVPYAFNYHFDQGIFRGLAFANFHSPAEANEVVSALNGLDVSGRKLRVEYKKVLQAGEKERIEKEKALKRMQFPHSNDKERKKDKVSTAESGAIPGLNVVPTPIRANSPNFAAHDKDGPHRLSPDGVSPIFFMRHSPSDAQESSLDLNDASTLEIYSRVLLFKDDRMRDDLSFSKCLTPAERRVVHLVAQKLGLYHYTVGSGDDRHVIVTKAELPSRHGASTPTSADVRESTSTRSELLAKKSVPDMRRAAYNDMKRSSSPNTMNSKLLMPHTGGNALFTSKSNSSLHEGYIYGHDHRFDGFGNFGSNGTSSHNLFAYPVDAPTVPYLPHASSVDLDRFDYASMQGPKGPSIYRSRSPLSSGHSPLGQTTGPLDHAMPTPFGPLPGSIHLPHRPDTLRDQDVDLSQFSSSGSMVPSNLDTKGTMDDVAVPMTVHSKSNDTKSPHLIHPKLPQAP